MKTLRHTLCIAILFAGAVALAWTSPAAADQVIPDDLIVQGSICAGFDCVNGESFGFDTLRLKENNLRIGALDTSTTASFPSNDWQITFNDSANGGANKFSIDDISGGRTPFTIEAGTPSHSLFVDDGGRIGFGTSTPVVELHVVDGDTPTLRLEQDGSSGFTPQTWDVAGNEANFFVRDATNGSKLPFRIKPNAPTDSINIGPNGVGVRTSSPQDILHVNSADAVTSLRVQSTSGGGSTWRFRANATTNQFVFQDGATNDSPFKIAAGSGNNRIFIASTGAVGINTNAPNAAAALDVNGPVYLRGAVLHADYVFEPSYELESIEEHAEAMWRERHLPAVSGRMVNEEGQEIIELGADRRGFLEELEKAHIYIEQLHNNLEAKNAEMAQLQARLTAIEAALGGPQQPAASQQ